MSFYDFFNQFVLRNLGKNPKIPKIFKKKLKAHKIYLSAGPAPTIVTHAGNSKVCCLFTFCTAISSYYFFYFNLFFIVFAVKVKFSS